MEEMRKNAKKGKQDYRNSAQAATSIHMGTSVDFYRKGENMA